MSLDLDIGPLSWVKGEIDLALERAGAALSAPAGKELAAACSHLHQAHGALAIVGLDGITEFSDALERLFVALSEGKVSDVGQAIAAAQAGVVALRGYLDGLMGGEPNQPLKLYPAYAGLIAARGDPAPGAVALFFPDLTQRPPRRDVEIPPPEGDKLAARLKISRMGFERGLLKWIKGDAKGIAEMRNSVAMIEATRAQPADRAFWWVLLGFLAALDAGSLPDAGEAKKLALKAGAQIKKLTEGQLEVPDRLLAEALYQVAVSAADPPLEAVETVRAAYRLAELMPRSSTTDLEAKLPLVRRLRELIAGAKEDWNRLCAGSAAALPPFHEKTTQSAERAAELGHAGVTRLLTAIATLTDALRRDPSRHTDTMALEIATALLLADNGLENFAAISADAGDYSHQVDTVAARLEALLAGRTLGELELPHLDAMSRRAQEKLLLSSVAREITSNLAQIEQALDAYFRDPGRAEGQAALKALERPLKQVEGALAVLGQDRACDVLRDCEATIAGLAAQGGGDAAQFESLAGRLSALGFFVEQLELGAQPDIDAIIDPSRARPAVDTAEPVVPAPAEAPVAAVPPAPSFDELPQAAEEAPAEPIPLPEPEPEPLPPPVVAPPQPSADSVRLAEASRTEIDSELLGIFLEEANEVLAAIGENLPKLHAVPADSATLTTVRRSFHTLKGSGRMVGLTGLGEAAWGVEQTLNGWLQEGKPASAGMLRMLDMAAALFRRWVDELSAGTGACPDPAPLAACCAALQAGEEPPAEETAADMVAGIEAREQARLADEVDAAEIAVAEAMAAYAAQLTEEVAASPATPMVDIADIVDFDLELPERELEPLAAGEQPSPPVAETPPVAEVLPFPPPAPVMIGEVAISPTLYAIFMEEARQHIATLQAGIGGSGMPDNELIRAAHTLGSIAGTTGIDAIHHLARALELALGRLAVATTGPTDDQRFIFARTAGALEGMVGAVANRRWPGEEAELAATLENLYPQVSPSGEAAEAVPPAATPPASGTEPPVPAATAAMEPPESLEERRARRMDDEIDPQLLPLFLEESVELMQSIGQELRAWRAAPADDGIARKLQRDLHTLKGSARMAGAMGCGELLHSMESRIEQAVAMQSISAEMLDSLETSYDRGAFLIERLRRGEYRGGPAQAALPAAEAATAPAPEAAAATAAVLAEPEAQAMVAAAAQAPVAPQVHLRVRADLIDRLVNESGEVAIARGRIEGEMRGLKASLLELTENVIRLRGQLRDIEIQAESRMQAQLDQMRAQAALDGVEFDPLEFDRFTRFQELTRIMAESVNDVSTIQHTLLKNLEGADAALSHQARLTRELSQHLMGVRMVPFETLADRLHRVVRQAAKDTAKRANLDIRGGQTGIDRSVLERIGAPLEHLLRNAVAHGIEAPAVREAAGKEALGQITIALAQEGNEVVIALSDDGGGLDFERIRARAVERGLLAADATPDQDTLATLIFGSGFSTVDEVTALAGRGVGMDVVRSEIEGLGGRVAIETQPGSGSTFRLYLPLTLAVSQAVIITAGQRRYAIPASMIEQASELRPEVIAKARIEGGTEWLGQRYPYHYLPRLLGDSHAQPIPARRHWLLLVKGGSERYAIEVDALDGSQEIVIKAIGPQLARVPGVAGATVLGDGAIALILNPVALGLRLSARHSTAAATDASTTTVVPALTDTQIQRDMRPQGKVMVVDDSLTVRKITGRLLGRQGYQVFAARDGLDALEQLAEVRPDVMLVDIEMPRMDGFELSRRIRADARLRAIPIIMITSRSADKHRQYAQEIGVNHYLGKPYDEEELLALVAGYVSAATQEGNPA